MQEVKMAIRHSEPYLQRQVRDIERLIYDYNLTMSYTAHLAAPSGAIDDDLDTLLTAIRKAERAYKAKLARKGQIFPRAWAVGYSNEHGWHAHLIYRQNDLPDFEAYGLIISRGQIVRKPASLAAYIILKNKQGEGRKLALPNQKLSYIYRPKDTNRAEE